MKPIQSNYQPVQSLYNQVNKVQVKVSMIRNSFNLILDLIIQKSGTIVKPIESKQMLDPLKAINKEINSKAKPSKESGFSQLIKPYQA